MWNLLELEKEIDQLLSKNDLFEKLCLIYRQDQERLEKIKINRSRSSTISSNQVACVLGVEDWSENIDYSTMIYELRCLRAQKLGFRYFTLSNMVKMLMGDNYTDIEAYQASTAKDYYYNSFTDTEGNNGLSFIMNFYLNRIKSNFFGFSTKKETVWHCYSHALYAFKKGIPNKITERLKFLKSLKLFNNFKLLAPIDAWSSKSKKHGEAILYGFMRPQPTSGSSYFEKYTKTKKDGSDCFHSQDLSIIDPKVARTFFLGSFEW